MIPSSISTLRSIVLPLLVAVFMGPATVFGADAVTSDVTGLTLVSATGTASSDLVFGGGSSGFSTNTMHIP
ncbi:MAG: hypothetical protein ACOVMP_09090 [Chthoniobacterales bacterium]